jgi:uncharacterized membrane protein
MAIGDYEVAHRIADALANVAIAVISVAVLVAAVSSFVRVWRRDLPGSFDVFKRRMGRGLLIGLDLLIAADIIETVTLEPTVENISALGLLVVIRTFLSWAVFLEIEERWPWQTRIDGSSPPDGTRPRR